MNWPRSGKLPHGERVQPVATRSSNQARSTVGARRSSSIAPAMTPCRARTSYTSKAAMFNGRITSRWSRRAPSSCATLSPRRAAQRERYTVECLRVAQPFHVIKAITLATSIAIAPGAAQSVLPRPVTLHDLTVPTDRLPTGCALSPAASLPLDGKRVRTGLWAGLPIAMNPWTGTDRPLIASIRERMDGPTLTPDGPPPTARELSRYRSRLADGVEEAYAA